MSGEQRQIEYVTTSDGARIACKRKSHAGGPPVILVHGLGVNADLWDLPEVRGEDYHYRSLAAILSEVNCDLWMVNLRGHGAPHALSESPPGQEDWCVDHFILYDLPAVIARVRAATGRRPFVIGNSMGAMTLSGHVQGARLIEESAGARIVADAETARQRAAELAGCVFVEFPAALRWPAALYDDGGGWNWNGVLRDWRCAEGDANYPFEILARWGWLQAIIEATGQVPLAWLRGDPGQPWWSRLSPQVAERVSVLEKSVVEGMLGLVGKIKGGTNYRAEVLLQGRRYVADHMKAGVLKQMAKSVRQGAFVSTLGSPDHVYSDNYQHITVPTLVIVGGRDRIANAEVTR
ncbi:MAG: alpha/beta fold hydrolase, partial [Planctomycetota bacterium]